MPQKLLVIGFSLAKNMQFYRITMKISGWIQTSFFVLVDINRDSWYTSVLCIEIAIPLKEN